MVSSFLSDFATPTFPSICLYVIVEDHYKYLGEDVKSRLQDQKLKELCYFATLPLANTEVNFQRYVIH